MSAKTQRHNRSNENVTEWRRVVDHKRFSIKPEAELDICLKLSMGPAYKSARLDRFDLQRLGTNFGLNTERWQ